MKDPIVRRLLAALMAVFAVVGCSDTGSGDGSTTTTTPGVQPIEDGTFFAFVTVGKDESGEMTLGIDLADLLTGEEARAAAVEDGVIAEGEDLPNDFYIDNDDVVLELVHADQDARFIMISRADVEEKIQFDSTLFAAIYDGTYTGDPLYGVVAGTPIAMDVIISDGLVSEATAVYLP